MAGPKLWAGVMGGGVDEECGLVEAPGGSRTQKLWHSEFQDNKGTSVCR